MSSLRLWCRRAAIAGYFLFVCGILGLDEVDVEGVNRAERSGWGFPMETAERKFFGYKRTDEREYTRGIRTLD